VLDVRLDGPVRYDEAVGDVPIGQSFRDEGRHLALAFGESAYLHHVILVGGFCFSEYR
jgi:hypothetical protein